METCHTEHFEDVYEQFYMPLQHYLLKLTGNPHDAADLAQEAFMKYWVKGFSAEAPKAWLYQTAYHLFVDSWRRKNKFRSVNLDVVPEPVGTDSPEKEWLELETEAQMNDAIGQLKPKARKAMLLRAQKGASYQEIADTIGCTENTVKSIVRRARTKLRSMIDGDLLATGTGC